MKFLKSLLLTIFALFQLMSIVNSKLKKRYQRNNRKVPQDPSYNPLPGSWASGPKHGFGTTGQNLDKYKQYSSRLAHYTNYYDTTAQLRKTVTGQ